MPQIIVLDGEHSGKVFPIQEILKIGSADSNDIVVQDRRVGEFHAHILKKEKTFYLEQLHTKKQTFVNSQPIKSIRLEHGDMIKIGDVTLLYSEETFEERDELLRATVAGFGNITSRIEHRKRVFDDIDTAAIEMKKDMPKESRILSLYKISGEISSSFELNNMLKIVLKDVFDVIPADRGAVLLWDSEQNKLVPVASRVKEILKPGETIRLSNTVIKEVMKTKEALVSKDAIIDERLRGSLSISSQSIRSVLCVPLIYKQKFTGILHLETSSSDYEFNDADLDFVSAIGVQLALSIENANIYKKRQEHSRNLIALGRATQWLSSYLQKEPILQDAVGFVSSILKCTKASIILIKKNEKGELTNEAEVGYAFGIDKKELPNIKIRVGEGYAGWVLKSGKPLVLPDIETEKIPPEIYYTRKSKYKTDSFLIVPIITQPKERTLPHLIIGALCAADKTTKGNFSKDDLELMNLLASQVAIALANAELYEKVTVDTLTRTFSRQYFFQNLEEYMKKCKSEKFPLSFIILDIDNFKSKNDTYGHIVGDVILKKLGSILKRSVRNIDIVGRFGGEEFCIIFPYTDLPQAQPIAERLRKTIEESTFDTNNLSLKVTVSIGLTKVKEDDTAITLIARADNSLYTAKRTGKNRVVVEV